MAAFVSDTFTDTAATLLSSHTGETGATWTKHGSSGTGNIVITDANMVRGTVNDAALYYASGSPVTAEYDVQALITQRSSVTDRTAGICGRLATGSHDMYLVQYEAYWARIQMFKCVTGTFTSLGTYSVLLGDGNSMTLKLEIRDAAKKAYIDSVERISSADNAVTAAGKAGLRLRNDNDNTNGSHVDTFVATDLVVASHIAKLALTGVG